MDDSGFKSTRLSLIIISAGIIIYILGGGSVNSASVFLGSINLTDTTPVKDAGVILFLYLLWRYILFIDHVTKNFSIEYKQFLYTSELYVKLAKAHIKSSVLVKKEDYIKGLEKYTEGDLYSKGSGADHQGSTYYYPPIFNNYFWPTFVYLPTLSQDRFAAPDELQVIRILPTAYNKNIDESFPVEPALFLETQLYILIKMIFLKRDFMDYIMPFFIAGWAFYLLVFNT